MTVRRSHLALQLSNTFSKLSLGGLWQLRVEALGEALPAALFVFTLRGQNTVNLCCLLFAPKRQVRNFSVKTTEKKVLPDFL